MLTPFKENKQIDYEGLSRLTEFYLASGARGLFANCLSSEMFELTDSERIEITKQVVNYANGQVPVVSTGSFGGTFEQQVDFIKRINDTGIQSVILSTGMLVEASEADELLEERFYQLLEATPGIKYGFYECPVPYKRLVSPALLKKFVETGRVNYFKDTCLDINIIKEKLEATKGADFGLYDAYMVHAVESLKAGSAGVSCIQGNYFPELIVWLCDNYADNALQQEVQTVQDFLTANMDVMHHVYPIVAKLFLQRRGFDISLVTRRDVGQLTQKEIAGIDRLFQDYQKLESDLALVAHI